MIVYRELSSLVRDLGISAKELYAVSNTLGRHYHKVRLPKRDGGERELSVPDPQLKHIQRRITQNLLVHMPISPYATAYRYGGSPLCNAAPHVGQPRVLKLDIRHFYDSVRYTLVKDKAFPEEIYADSLRILLSMLCYCRDVLPQGAPSSPAISNIILRDFDNQVGAWCRERKIAYTRYCDDMTFSGAVVPGEVVPFVSKSLKELGFRLNGEKTALCTQGQRQTVTGIVVNRRPNLPAQERRALRQELYFCQKFGVASHMERIGVRGSEADYLRRLLGRVSYALQITPEKRELLQARAWLAGELARRESRAGQR